MSAIRRLWNLSSEFGISVTGAKLFQSCTRKISKVNELAGRCKYHAITDFLYKENKDLLDDFNRKTHSDTAKIEDGNVWVLWWQGLESAPDIVKLCVNSIKANVGDRKLIVLDEDNYRDYTDINPRYEKMFKDEVISKTQFSDLLRLNLLYNRGGVWLDSTYLMTGELPEYVSELHFFTIRHGMNKEYPMSKGLWTSSALGVAAYSDEIRLFLDVYDRYFEKHQTLIDYLLTDYIFAVCCDHCGAINRMFHAVPKNNVHVNDLLQVMNQPYSEELVRNVTKETTMNKCNRRFPFQSDISGTETVYGYFRNIYL